MKKIYLYGIGGAYDSYRLIQYMCLGQGEVSARSLKFYTDWMIETNPSIRRVFMVDGRPGLAEDAQNSLKRPTIENCIIFKDICEREGVELHVR